FQDTASISDPIATRQLLNIVNSRDVTQIRSLKGVGAKKAEAIVNALFEMNEGDQENLITDLRQLGALPGVGVKSVENMLVGLGVAA
ncbi:helix-hairpin-helix domain-containing protein, partial [Enterococcus faecalis]|uniref:helix-hairpin-helix domain-containing protein n=1 Tax=Enterococcus faecalis TaxID=1351 RepID=UPI0030C84F44